MVRKLHRQLKLFHIFYFSQVIEMADIKSLICVSDKTIFRDINELKEAGLIDVEYSKKHNGYVHKRERKCPFDEPMVFKSEPKNLHIGRLRRLARIMIDFRWHEEIPYYELEGEEQKSCSDLYRELFPELSKKTMQRDFKDLNEIGYEIRYSKYDKCYHVWFPEGLEEMY